MHIIFILDTHVAKLVNKIDNCIAMGFFKNYRAFYPVLFVTKPYRDN